ncbi:MAG: 3-dehydroquinate synthase, partial [Nitrospinota bacterium]|nr:3-dehydroquinate synthase [Nitrospinota bacterium]
GIIADEMLFNFLESRVEDIKNLDFNALQYIIEASCKIKASIVSKDEQEKGLRSVLNYGHTIGHALESITGYEKYKHGEAVAIGMIAAAFISHEAELCDKKDVERVKKLIESFNLATQLPNISPEKILSALYYDKKVRNDKIKLVLMKKLGSVVIRDDIPDEIILKSLSALTS